MRSLDAGDERAALVRNLRRLRPTLPIVMVSGSPEARALGEAVGVSAFVDKGQAARELVDQIRRVLAGRVDDHNLLLNPAVAVLPA